WKAVLKSGKPAVVHEIPVPPAEATASVPRMQRLFEHRHPALSPVLAWGIDNNGLWVAVEPNEGTPLGTILTPGPLTPPAAAARAQGALREMAAALLAPDRQVAAQSELATRAGGREVPAITPFLPEGTVAPTPPSGPTAAVAAPPAPAPYIAPQRREETPLRV